MLTAWFDAAPDRRRYPKLEGRASADVVVVGGGIVGAAAAWRGAEIECPWHGLHFDVRTGAVKEGPAIQPQPRYEARVEKWTIEVKL